MVLDCKITTMAKNNQKNRLQCLHNQKIVVPLHRFRKEVLLKNRSFGEVAEWSIAAVLKTVVLRGTRGSNPCLSADKGCKSSNYEIYILFLYPSSVIIKYDYS